MHTRGYSTNCMVKVILQGGLLSIFSSCHLISAFVLQFCLLVSISVLELLNSIMQFLVSQLLSVKVITCFIFIELEVWGGISSIHYLITN